MGLIAQDRNRCRYIIENKGKKGRLIISVWNYSSEKATNYMMLEVSDE